MKASEYSKLYIKLREILIEGNYGIQSDNEKLFIENGLVSHLDPNFQKIPEDFVIILHRVFSYREQDDDLSYLRLYAQKDYDLDELLKSSEMDEDNEGHSQDCKCEYCSEIYK